MMCIWDFSKAMAYIDKKQNDLGKHIYREANETHTLDKQQQDSSDQWSLKMNLFQYSFLVPSRINRQYI